MDKKKSNNKKKTKKTPKRQPKPSDEKLLSFNGGKKYNLVENNHKAEADIQNEQPNFIHIGTVMS